MLFALELETKADGRASSDELLSPGLTKGLASADGEGARRMALALMFAGLAALAAGPTAGLTVRYFGFGANVDQQLMQRRIGGTPLSAEPAMAKGYRLAFTALGFGPEPGFASIERSKMGDPSEIHGVLYTLDAAQMARLCATEAVPLSYSVISFRCTTYDGQAVGACALQANGPGLLVEAALGTIRPSERYLGVIRAGAKASGLADSWLQYLETIEAAPPGLLQIPASLFPSAATSNGARSS